MSRLRALSIPLGIGLLCLSWESSASAHDLVEQGRQQAFSGLFQEAMTTFRRAETGTDLRLDDLAGLLEGRAFARLGAGDTERALEDMRLLASIAPSYVLGGELPPDLRQAFVEASAEPGAALRVRVRVDRGAGAAAVVASATGRAASLVRSIDLEVTVDDRPLVGTGRVELPREFDTVEYRARAVLAGGARFGEVRGRYEAPRPTAAGGPAAAGGDAGSGGGVPTWVWIGAGAVAVVAAVVVAVLLVSSASSDQTLVVGPAVP